MAPLSRLKGFAMLESIFAMVVIMICFGISMMIFNMITSGGAGTRKVNARIRLQSEANLCKEHQSFEDDVIVLEEFTIEKSFVMWRESDVITEMHFTARDPDGNLIAEYHELLVRQ